MPLQYVRLGSELVMDGGAVTATEVVAVSVHPGAYVTLAVYVVFTAGVATVVEQVVQDTVPDGVQLYTWLGLVGLLNVEGCPAQIEEGLAVMVKGTGVMETSSM